MDINNIYVLLPENFIPLNKKAHDLLNIYFCNNYKILYLSYNNIINFILKNNNKKIKIILYFVEDNCQNIIKYKNLYVEYNKTINRIKKIKKLYSKIYIFIFDFWQRGKNYNIFLLNVFTPKNYKVITSAYNIGQLNSFHNKVFNKYSNSFIFYNIWSCYNNSFCTFNNNPIVKIFVSGCTNYSSYPERNKISKMNGVILYNYNKNQLENNNNSYNLELNTYIACFSSSVYVKNLKYKQFVNTHVILQKTYEILAAGSLLVMPLIEKKYLERIGIINNIHCYLIDFNKDIQQQINELLNNVSLMNQIRLNGYNLAKNKFKSIDKFNYINNIIKK